MHQFSLDYNKLQDYSIKLSFQELYRVGCPLMISRDLFWLKHHFSKFSIHQSLRYKLSRIHCRLIWREYFEFWYLCDINHKKRSYSSRQTTKCIIDFWYWLGFFSPNCCSGLGNFQDCSHILSLWALLRKSQCHR